MLDLYRLHFYPLFALVFCDHSPEKDGKKRGAFRPPVSAYPFSLPGMIPAPVPDGLLSVLFYLPSGILHQGVFLLIGHLTERIPYQHQAKLVLIRYCFHSLSSPFRRRKGTVLKNPRPVRARLPAIPASRGRSPDPRHIAHL